MTTDRLVLRPPVESDLQRLFDIYGDARTNTHNPAGPFANIDTARTVLTGWMAHWQQHGFGKWAISAADDPSHVIGFGGIDHRRYIDEDKINLGYRFGVEAWGKGYATELGRASLALAFDALGLPDVFGIVRPANTASIRVLEKVGMHWVGAVDDVPGAEPSRLYRAENGGAQKR
ncbi:GNAT family N-acetyltransferase [Montanilutibacter psychrotolerans]|uniref:N-acetyltransferase n=1 Tax=Montanilutibacter psychrotolerans TaxID=1327343 RepID=A0A3M8SRA4_9GAMM|nr:GNAT family N-acetyltransferase [Lysobacter psychrotolerans]RNF83245.1 N-acetyltransferase [Lysobacter psychrotolerans]